MDGDERAAIIGKRMFEFGEPPWGENPPFHRPVFVLTREPKETIVKEGGTSFTFVTDGIEPALELARAAAGDKDIAISGGATTIQQYLRVGLIDELNLHLIPVVLGGDIRFFEETSSAHIKMERTKAMLTPGVTHLWFRPLK